MAKRMRFFEKDTVPWGNYSKTQMYRTIYTLNHENQALWNGAKGGQPEFYSIDSDVALAWKRSAGSNDVVVAVNLGDANANMKLDLDGSFTAAWGEITPDSIMMIPGHSAAVWTRNRTK